MSLLSSVLSVPSLQGWQSHPCWRWGTVTEWLENCSSHVFEGAVMGMIYVTQYGILTLYRHKCIQVMRCNKCQS